MLSKEEVNELGNILNHTWGQSGGGITSKIHGDRLLLSFSTIVHFASESSLQQQMPGLVDESMQLLIARLGDVKKQFKEATGNALKTSEFSNKDDVQLISATSNSPRKIAYYNRDLILDIQN
jgi:hypothetical protein